MYGEIITIGNELLSGRSLDLNAWYAAGRLTASGLRVLRITSVADDYDMVSEAIEKALITSRYIIITGGLGSTEDDITNEIVAKFLDRPLARNSRMYQKIKSYAEARGIEMTPSLEKMAWMPEGSKLLNPRGIFCGFSLVHGQCRLYFLPGVPDQMRYLMDKFVLPEILGFYKTLPVMRQRVLKLYGLSEPRIAEIFKKLQGRTGEVVFGFYPHFPENHITLSLRSSDEATVIDELDRVESELRELVGPYIFASGNKSMEEVVGDLLMEKGMTISLAESCTGGLIGHRLTNVPGSSSYFVGGTVAYSNRIKVDFLHVNPQTLDNEGAVSGSAAREMARGARIWMKTDLGLAVTGIAGPEGGSEEKPVGTVHLALATKGETFERRYRFWGTREQVKLNSSMMALDWVRRYLHGNSFLPGI